MTAAAPSHVRPSSRDVLHVRDDARSTDAAIVMRCGLVAVVLADGALFPFLDHYAVEWAARATCPDCRRVCGLGSP